MPAKKESSPKTPKKFQCMFILYPESQQAAIEYCQTHLPCAWALHDKDTRTQRDLDKYIEEHNSAPEWKVGDLKKPHVHFVCRFKNQRYFSAVAKEISKGSGVEIPVNTICRCDHLYNAYVYLWHLLDEDKFQYDPAIVGLHDFDPPQEGGDIGQEEGQQIELLLDMPVFDTFGEMGRWAYENGCWAVFKKNYSLWRDIFLERRNGNRVPSGPVKKPLDELYGPGMLPLRDEMKTPFDE